MRKSTTTSPHLGVFLLVFPPLLDEADHVLHGRRVTLDDLLVSELATELAKVHVLRVLSRTKGDEHASTSSFNQKID